MVNLEHMASPKKGKAKIIDSNLQTPLWIYGQHAVIAALNNPKRKKHRLVYSLRKNTVLPRTIKPELIDHSELSNLLPPGAVHQGIALLTSPLPNINIANITDDAGSRSILIILDQIKDPRNIGAILRSSVAFNVDAVIVPDRNSPHETPALAKSASGALDLVPLIREPNISRTIDRLKKCGYWCAGLDQGASQTIAEAGLSGKIALVLGEEGKGIRHLTRKKCDYLIRIPINQLLTSLNVASAAAIALYELNRG